MMSQVIMERKKIYSGSLLLVNARYPLKNTVKERKKGLVPACVNFPAILLKRDAANILQMVLEKIATRSLIVPVSGYRTQKEQEDIYNTSLRDNGEDFTKKYVALPCHSEHQTGLAIDLGIYKEKIDFIRPDFPYTGICNSGKLHHHMVLLSATRRIKKKLQVFRMNPGISGMLDIHIHVLLQIIILLLKNI